MAYRDRGMSCPRCGVDLAQYPKREKWRCRDCGGVLAGLDEMPPPIAEIEWPTAKRARARPVSLKCPVCARDMHRFSVVGVELDRCELDGYVWFDSGELGFLDAYLAEPL